MIILAHLQDNEFGRVLDEKEKICLELATADILPCPLLHSKEQH